MRVYVLSPKYGASMLYIVHNNNNNDNNNDDDNNNNNNIIIIIIIMIMIIIIIIMIHSMFSIQNCIFTASISHHLLLFLCSILYSITLFSVRYIVNHYVGITFLKISLELTKCSGHGWYNIYQSQMSTIANRKWLPLTSRSISIFRIK